MILHVYYGAVFVLLTVNATVASVVGGVIVTVVAYVALLAVLGLWAFAARTTL